MGLFDLNSTQKTMIAGIAFTNIQVLALIAIAGGAAAYHWHLGPFKQGGGTGYCTLTERARASTVNLACSDRLPSCRAPQTIPEGHRACISCRATPAV